MATSPPASDKTITDTTNTVVEANKTAAAAAETAEKARHKDDVKGTAEIVKAVGDVGKAVGTPPEIIVNIPAPVIPIPPVDTSLKDISKSLANAVGKLAFDKTLGKLPDSIKSIGSTISGVVLHPTKTLASMGESVLGKLNSWGGLGDIGANILDGIAPGGGEVTVEGGEEGEEKSKLAEDSNGLLGQLVEAFWAVQDIQANMLNIMVNDSAEAAEAAREAARAGMVGADKGAPDAKVEEAKAGGFFSRMGAAVMNPMKALGSGMSKIGKGIQGILTGIARGLMAFANPLVLVGVTFLSLSLPILAAGLAAAFKVFDMIAGKGAALDILTGIITSLGTAIGTILKDVLHGLGLMIGAAGPAILDFFKGVGIVIEALTPIISLLVPIIDSLMAALTAILTNAAFNETLQTIVISIKEIVLAVIDLAAKMLPTLEVLFAKIESIVKTVGDVIITLINGIVAVVKTIGDTIVGTINAIGDVIKIVGDVIVKIITAIGDTVTKVIDGIVSGIERLAALDGSNLLVVAAALLALGGSLVIFAAGAAVAGAFMPSKEELASLADSVSKFGDIDATNFAAVGTGMALIGAGLAAFGAGGAIASLLNDPEGLIGVATSVEKFGKIDASNFAMVGTGIEAIGTGLMAFAGGGFLSSLAEGFGSLIGASDPVEKFQKFSKLGPGLKEASEGIKTLALAMKTFEKTVKEFDLSKVDAVAEGLAKIRDAQDPGALSKIGGIVGSIFGSGDDDDEKKGGGGQGVPALITETNLLLKQGMLTGPSGLFGSPGIGTSAFLMTKQNKEQIDTGQKLNELQEESNSLGGSGATTVVVNNQDNSQNVQSSQPLVLPTPAIAPGNGGANLPTG
jgi:hypothetical protein